MKNIKNINIKNKKVLIRVDYNVPIENGKIKNSFRLEASAPTIHYCLTQGASIILMSHLGRPENKDESLSLKPIIDYLEDKYNVYVHFSDDCISDESINTSKKMLPKEIHLLENLRYYNQESSNDEVFSYKLSKHAEIYINDAFGTAHRSHASNSSILKFFKIKSFGLLMLKELEYLMNDDLINGSVLIVGGAKISTKLKLIYNFIGKSSHVLIGGAMAFTFLKAKNVNIGNSLHEPDMIQEAKNILQFAEKSSTAILLPSDVVSSKSIEEANDINVNNFNEIQNDDIGLDIGPETTLQYDLIIGEATNIIWNGPLGMFENLNFATGTQAICDSIKRRSLSEDCVSIVGGGDTIRAAEHFTSINGFTHVSTGGGASLKLLSGETLEILKSWEKYEK